ncbi:MULTISPECIES: CBS domain-containing protein [unclassified Pseudonocardia]|uniref:CBS domain-containing protein n=1 Tax=unclassified Pseudonocardia TaxID=2619320 RepID=UPI000969C845|nr:MULTISPECIES: CBS domain-containing protein [unclassified Pseudonocardia]MBN9096635.1 CBS domain-containing protein [Pseudonocardia sp.]OJY53347.1 MAG: histidine kinase [Pseudonocardia sp. 73-21]
MRVADILKVKGDTVVTVRSWTPLRSAIDLLAGPPAIGALVVSDDGHGHVSGIVAERDIIRGLHRRGASTLEQTVADVMVRGVPVCSPEDPITKLMATMTRSRHRHLPVLSDGVLCGIVSIGDVVRHRLDEMQLETAVLRDMYVAGR